VATHSIGKTLGVVRRWARSLGWIRGQDHPWDADDPERRFDPAVFTRIIGYSPKTWDLFFEALLHRSYLPHAGARWKSNERLEFLGDAILNFTVAEHLFQNHPGMEEGDLTKVRSRLVNRRILAARARRLSLHEFVLLSPSALQSLEGGSESILSDAFEALVGAIYLDGGAEEASRFVHRALLSDVDVLNGAQLDDNYKSALMEFSQSHALGIPRYTVVAEDGPDHDRRFTVEVSVGNHSLSSGTGKSKKEAEQSAAEGALRVIHDYHDQILKERENANPAP
jgi:ribonuclease-3